MKNMTKAELLNEIKALQADAVHDASELDKKSNEIRQLRGDLAWHEQLEDEYRSEIKRLEQTARARLDTIVAMSNKNSKLQKAYDEINGAYWSSLRSQRKKDNEIKDLRHDYDNRQAIITEMRNENKRLHQHIDDDEIAIENKQNEINNLRCDIDYRQTIITEMRSEINELEARVADLEQKRNDSRKFYWATEALGNPKHFQEVT